MQEGGRLTVISSSGDSDKPDPGLVGPRRISAGPCVDPHIPEPPNCPGPPTPFRTACLLFSVLMAVLLVTACAVRETGRPQPSPSNWPTQNQITYDEVTAGHAGAFARARTIDMCALHNVAAAERITRTTASSLRLTTGLATCDLETRGGDPPARWRIELGFGSRLATDWTRIELAGAEVQKNPDAASGCEYFVSGTGTTGLTVRVGYTQAASTGSPASRVTKPCAIAERYLAEAVLPQWSDPPTLDKGLTEPRIPLLGKDPCAALAAGVADVQDERGRNKTYSMSNPYSCQGARGSTISAYTVEFKVFSAILDLRGHPVRIGEFTAYPDGGVGAGGCSFQIAVQPDLVFSVTERTVYNGGIVIGLPACDDTTVAEKVLDNLVRQPDAPPAKPDAQLIGDLDGP